MLRTSLLRLPTTASTSSIRIAAPRVLAAQQCRHAHAISNPTLANIEKRWEAMPPQEQADLWMALRDRMKADWNELTLQEKKAGMSYPKASPAMLFYAAFLRLRSTTVRRTRQCVDFTHARDLHLASICLCSAQFICQTRSSTRRSVLMS
jgi:hypothetical protein